MYEYIPYVPVVNKPELVKTPASNDIDVTLSIMQKVQCNNIEPTQEPTQEPVKEPEPTEESFNAMAKTPDEIIEKNKEPTQETKEEPTLEPKPEPVKESVEKKPLSEYIRFNHSSSFFKRIFKLVNVVSGEAKIFFTSDKIYTSIVDPSHVLMLTLEIPKHSTTEYEIKDDISLGFDIDKLSYILRNCDKNDSFSFMYDSNKDLFKAFITNGLFNHTYTLMDKKGLMEPKIPKLDLPSTFRLNTKMFYAFLVQAEKLTDYIEIAITKDNLTLNAVGDSDKVSITLNRDQIELFECGSTYRSLYSIDFLLSIVNQLKTLFDDLTFNMGNDTPLRIVGDNGYKATVLVAPRIESE